MKIIDDVIKPYWIEANENCYTVFEGKLSRNGNLYHHDKGYYSSLARALNKVATLRTEKANKTYDLKSYIEELRNNRIKIQEKLG